MTMDCIGYKLFKSKKGVPFIVLHCVRDVKQTDTEAGRTIEDVMVSLESCQEVFGIPASQLVPRDFIGKAINVSYTKSGWTENVEIVT